MDLYTMWRTGDFFMAWQRHDLEAVFAGFLWLDSMDFIAYMNYSQWNIHCLSAREISASNFT